MVRVAFSNLKCITNCNSDHVTLRNVVLQYTKDVDEFTPTAIQGFNWDCQERMLQDQQNYAKGVNGGLIPPPEVTSDMCSNVCSLHGNCVHGICACDHGFSGVDCSVEDKSVPAIIGIKG